MNRVIIFVVLMCAQYAVQADAVYEKTSNADFDAVYTAVYESLESDNFYVIYELNIGQSMARFGEKWGDDYNRSKLSAYKSMIVCSAWYANQVSNADPKMLALCPLRVNLIQRQTVTSVLFERPTAVAQGSPALSVLQEVETKIITAIDRALDSVQ